MDEALLVNEIRRGNSDAFNEMFISFYSPLCEYASQFISDENAEELVQNLMLYVWEERENLTVERSLRSYLFTSVRNRALNAIRNHKYRQNVHSALYEKLRYKFENPDFYMTDDLSAKIQESIDSLPESYRETFRLSRFGEMTNAKIASTLDVSIKTVADVREAIEHVARHSSKHSEAIVTENGATARLYERAVDAACVYVNVSTAFTDGAQFGFGAEIGISTQKLHARGPMALAELTSYKYLIEGDGQIRN